MSLTYFIVNRNSNDDISKDGIIAIICIFSIIGFCCCVCICLGIYNTFRYGNYAPRDGRIPNDVNIHV